jgi:hypothetical protein
MKKKMRKFADGGFTSDQEKWLGGADRTDPYILARMRSANPDAPSPSESMIEDESGRGNISPNAAAFNKGTGNEPVTKTVSQSKVSVTKPKSSWDDSSKISAMPDAPRKVETPQENKTRMESLVKKQALIPVEPENYVPGAGMLKGLLKGVIGNAAKKQLKTYTAREMEEMTPKIGREALKLTREPVKLSMKHGGSVKKMSSGGKVSSASNRADGCAIRGKTRA